MTLFTPDSEEPTVIDQMLDCIPEGTPYADVLEALSGMLAGVIMSAADQDAEVMERLLQVVQSDLRTKVNGRTH